MVEKVKRRGARLWGTRLWIPTGGMWLVRMCGDGDG